MGAEAEATAPQRSRLGNIRVRKKLDIEDLNMTIMERIQDFLGQKRFAIVGVSQSPKDFSRALFREFRERGYEPVPVNPAAREIEGQPCFPRLQEIQPPVEACC